MEATWPTPVTGWLELPWQALPASVRVDVLGVLAYGKPAIRIPTCDNRVANTVTDVIAAAGWSHARDEEYLISAPSTELARHILEVDRSPQPHTLELGLLLGYPECCARAAAASGEANIDHQAVRLGADCDRAGRHELDPRGYPDGIALIPYVACSPGCDRAIRHANAAWRYIDATLRAAEAREPWQTWRRACDLLRDIEST